MTGNAEPLTLHVFSTFKAGGPQVRTVKLIEELGRHRRHCIVAMDGQYDALELFKDKNIVEHAPPPSDGGGLITRLLRYRRWLNSFHPEKVYTYNWGSVEVAMAAQFIGGIERLHLEDGFGPEEAQKQLPRRIWFRRFALRRVKQIIVPSQTLRDIATKIWKFGAHKVQLIENGIDVGSFDRVPDYDLLGLQKKDGDIWIGTVAGLRHEKRLDRLIDAFARLKSKANCHLLLIGTGYLQEQLQKKVEGLGLERSVHFPGFIPEPQRYLKALDIFALTSDTEQFPISLVEAMAASRPVVSTDVGDIKAILPEIQHMLLYEKQDVDGFQTGLQRLVDDEELRLTLGSANQEKVARDYDEKFMLDAYRPIIA